MKVIRKLGNNAAVALDRSGKEIIILGRGISSGVIPFEVDMGLVEKTFYNVNPIYLEMIASITDDVLLTSADIVEQAEFNLDCELNPNLTFTLADHLQFAMKRVKEGIDIQTPIAYDVMHLYPQEYELGLLAIDIVRDYVKITLPQNEAVNVALHIVNSEIETGSDFHNTMETLRTIDDLCVIIEDSLKISVDRHSYEYSRFIIHIRYLLQRLSEGETEGENVAMLHGKLISDYPEIYGCIQRIEKYLFSEYGWRLGKEEITYLMIHIIRLKNKTA